MVEGASGSRLLLEAPEAIGISGGVRGQDLDGYLAPEALVARAVDLPHPARAEGSQGFVGAEARARLHWHEADPGRVYIGLSLRQGGLGRGGPEDDLARCEGGQRSPSMT